MGYSTSFEGKIELSRPLTSREAKNLSDFCEARHDGPGGEGPGAWCDWRLTEDLAGLVWGGQEKTYDFSEWLAHLVSTFLRPMGVVASGEVAAQGEEPTDMWILRVEDNVVTRHDAVVTAVYGSGRVVA